MRKSVRSLRSRGYCLLLVLSPLALLDCSGTDNSTLPEGSGGDTALGGAQATGGSRADASTSGGAPSTGGFNAGGGTNSTGGMVTAPIGGTIQAKSSGGQSSLTGGAAPTGGRSGSGGTLASGGESTGGMFAGGGKSVTGGTVATGGAGSTGGTVSVGGKSAAGGALAGGASSATGGASAGGTTGTCNASAGAQKKNTKLPDPFTMHDGTRITTKAQWPCRRAEIRKDIEKYEIGARQESPTVAATYAGNTLTVKVTTSSGSINLTSTVSGSGSCVVIGMNGNSSLVSGCVQVPFMHDQVVGYNNGSSTQSQSDPYYKVYPDQWGKIGNYSAWSWGISRIIDGLDQVKDQLKIDMTKIAVHGCSYAGKMALFGGAFDERVALTIAQESGGGGINSWRTSQDFTTRTGTNIEKIDNTSSAWFLSSMLRLDPYSLPHDHHELIAMIAPRAIVALGNADYDWLGDESGYKSIMAAEQVWIAMGALDHIGFDFTSGHTHCQAATSQINSVNAFVGKYLKGQTTANTSIAIKPTKSTFDLDYTKVIDWTTPTLQ